MCGCGSILERQLRRRCQGPNPADTGCQIEPRLRPSIRQAATGPRQRSQRVRSAAARSATCTRCNTVDAVYNNVELTYRNKINAMFSLVKRFLARLSLLLRLEESD